MTDEEKAIEKELDGIIEEILKWQNRKKVTEASDCCFREREKGFQEGLRLSGAIVRARYIQVEEEEAE
jgi:hypothetical protein